MIIPLLVLMKIIENVKVSARKARKKNKGKIPVSAGFVKNIKDIKNSQSRIVVSRVKKKFFLSFISFFLISFFFFINFILPIVVLELQI